MRTSLTVTNSLAGKQPKVMTGTVATASATSAKTVTLDSPWASVTPAAGDVLRLTWTNGNSASSATLAVNGGSAFSIASPSGSTSALDHSIAAGYAMTYTFDGTRWLTVATTLPIAEITNAEIIGAASGGFRYISGVRAAYLKRKAIATAVTSSATPALSLDLGDCRQSQWHATSPRSPPQAPATTYRQST